ncbi:hypothetical protein [Kitasatospora sp. NPDC059327]|uniref:hypothetical protein n=1 Tax=Kitasatospora sp. NPDC059327 TaxID=3346803 RepID=UPI00369902C3
MRATWMAAALTAAIVLTPVATASATAAGQEAAAPRTFPFSAIVPGLPGFPAAVAAPAAPARPAADAPLPVAVPPVSAPVPGLPAAPAAPDLSAVPDPGAVLGTVGDLVGTVTGLIPSLLSALPDLGLQQLLASLQTIVQGLLGQLPTPPVTVPAPPAVPGGTAPALSEQLASLKVQSRSLTDAAAALRARPTVG